MCLYDDNEGELKEQYSVINTVVGKCVCASAFGLIQLFRAFRPYELLLLEYRTGDYAAEAGMLAEIWWIPSDFNYRQYCQ